jgi:hypothetical protein
VTYAIRNNRLLAARMRLGCDGRVRAYRERAWAMAIKEARERSFFSSVLFAASQWVTLLGYK